MTISIKSMIWAATIGLGLCGPLLAQTSTDTTAAPTVTDTPTVVTTDNPPALPPALPVAPEPASPPPLPPQPEFFIDENGTPGGPYKMAQLQGFVAAGTLTSATLAWTDGMAEWAAANTVAGLEPLFVAAVTPAPTPAPTPVAPAVDLATFVVGNWKQTGDVDIPGVGLGRADLSAMFGADGKFVLGGTIEATNADTGTMMIQVNATGTFVVQSSGPDTFSVTQTGSATMTIPGFAPVQQPVAETTNYTMIDANTIEDIATGDRLIRQP